MDQKIIELEAFANSLGRLCLRWVEDKCGALVGEDVFLFRSLTDELKGILNTIQGISAYLNAFAAECASAVQFLLNNAKQNHLLLDFLIKVNDEQMRLHKLLSIADALKKALKLLCSQPLNPCVKINRNDPFGFRPLLVATAIVNESASKARITIDQFKSVEKEWQQLEQSIRVLDSTATSF